MNLALSSPVSRQYVSFYWSLLAFTSGALNALFVLFLMQTFRLDLVFICSFIAVSVIVPVVLSTGCTIYLSGIGEKRLLRVVHIELLSAVIIALVEYTRTIILGTSFGNAVFLLLYLLFLGMILDGTTVPFLGISGGRSQCETFLLVSDEDVSKMQALLEQPTMQETLESLPLKKVGDFSVLRDTEDVGFNWFVFLFPHPTMPSRSALVFMGYNRSSIEIRGGRLAFDRLRGKVIYVTALLAGKVIFDSSQTLNDFVTRFPEFNYRVEQAYRYALRPTEIPLSRIRKLSGGAKAILLTVIVALLVSISLLAMGYIDQGEFVLTLAPEIVLVGAQVLPLVPRRRKE